MGKSLIIKGADFSVNGFIEFGYTWSLQKGLSLNATGTGRSGAGGGGDRPSRATILVPRSECSNPVTWNDTMEGYEGYSTADVKPLMSKITISVSNPNYYFAPILKNESGTDLIGSEYNAPGSPFAIDLTQYPTAKRFYVAFKIGNAGKDNFTNETLESMGVQIVIE